MTQPADRIFILYQPGAGIEQADKFPFWRGGCWPTHVYFGKI